MRYSYIFAFLFSILITNNSTAQEIRSQWQSAPITIDGNASDWPETFRYYDGNTMLQFAIANDTNNFYVCLKANDAQTQRNLLRAGLNIWLDPKGKKKEISGIAFPMRKEMVAPPQGQMMQGPGGGRRDMNNMKQHVLLTQNTLVIYGLAGIGKEIVPLKGSYGIEAAISWDSLDIMVLEYKIPATALFLHPLTATDTTKLISFGLVIAADQGPPGEHKPHDDQDTDPNAGGMGNGGLMRNNGVGGDIGRDPNNMNSGQSGGSMGMNGPPPAIYTAQDQRVWLKLRLAAH